MVPLSDRRRTCQAVHPQGVEVLMTAMVEWEIHIQSRTLHKDQMAWVLDSRCTSKSLYAVESCLLESGSQDLVYLSAPHQPE